MASIGSEGKSETDTARHTLGFTLPFADKAPVHPAEFMAAMTMASMAIGTQVANTFFGMMQAAFEHAPGRPAAPVSSGEPRVETAAGVVEENPVVAEAETRGDSRQAKPSRRKPASIKKIVAVETAPSRVRKPRSGAKSTKLGSGAGLVDLKKISGVGPKLEGLLNSMGVLRLEQIAEWSDKDVEHFDLELGLDGRIVKDGWIAQAKALLR